MHATTTMKDSGKSLERSQLVTETLNDTYRSASTATIQDVLIKK